MTDPCSGPTELLDPRIGDSYLEKAVARIDLDSLIDRLREEGATGLDLSPGDPHCRDAAIVIRALRKRVAELEAKEARAIELALLIKERIVAICGDQAHR